MHALYSCCYYTLFLIQQLNSSECCCAPNNCEQTDIAFKKLKNSTERCFEDGNIPISTVAKKIKRDADKLRRAVEKLLEVNPRSHTTEDCSFNYTQIESEAKYKQPEKEEIQWCYY